MSSPAISVNPQEAQLYPRDRAMRRVSWNLANCHATVQKLLVQQLLNKSKLWSWRVKVGRCVINMCTQPWRVRVALGPENQSPWAIVWCCFCDPTFSRFSGSPTFDGRTDRQTDRRTDTGPWLVHSLPFHLTSPLPILLFPFSSLPTPSRSFPSYDKIRYDTRCYFNVRSKADISQLNLPHGTDN